MVIWTTLKGWNWWKIGFFLLLGGVLTRQVWLAYWHVRWVDAELWTLHQSQLQIIQWINTHSVK